MIYKTPDTELQSLEPYRLIAESGGGEGSGQDLTVIDEPLTGLFD